MPRWETRRQREKEREREREREKAWSCSAARRTKRAATHCEEGKGEREAGWVGSREYGHPVAFLAGGRVLL